MVQNGQKKKKKEITRALKKKKKTARMGPDSYCVLIGADIRKLQSTLADPHLLYEVDIPHGKCNKQAGKNEVSLCLKNGLDYP